MNFMKKLCIMGILVGILLMYSILLAEEDTLTVKIQTVGDAINDLQSLDLNKLIDYVRGYADSLNYHIQFEFTEEQLQELQQLNDLDIDLIISDDLGNYSTIRSTIQPLESRYETPYLGVYTSGLTFTKARELGYKKDYGVLITRVVDNSPAQLHRLIGNDIIMSIDNIDIMDDTHFSRVLSSYYVGDVVRLLIYRDGIEFNQDVELGSRNTAFTTSITLDSRSAQKKKTKKSTGYGGGSYYPIWTIFDMDDINYVFEQLDYDRKFSKDGILFHGLGGKGPIGKGYFLGGMFACYFTGDRYSIKIGDNDLERKVSYGNLYGGVTLDKRFSITKNFIVSPGFMLGGGYHEIEVAQFDNIYNWDSLKDDFSNHNNFSTTFSKSYLVVKPNFEMMYRVLPWLALRAEVGYIYGYSARDGWRTHLLDSEDYNTANSPNTKYEGLTFSIGPWFGF